MRHMAGYRRYGGNVGRSLAWYSVVATGLLLEWWQMKEQLGIGYSNIIGTAVKAAGDIVFLLVPYWLLKPRWRWTAILPLVIFSLWCVVNLAYCRFWGDMVPAAAITMGGNVDGDLMQYGASLLKRSDLVFAAVPVVAMMALWWLRPWGDSPFSAKFKIWGVAISLLAVIAGQFSYFKTAYSWRNAIDKVSLREGLSDHFFGEYTGQILLYRDRGLAYYAVRISADAIGLLFNSLTLTKEDRREIAGFLDGYRLQAGGKSKTDSLNVVYIIVESLNADMVGKKIEGVPVMPVLDSLSRREGTVVMDRVVSQIKAASSSDGHLLLMTGLLPPDKVAYSIMYGSQNEFPSLADALPGHNKYLLLADDGVCWNEGNTLRNFRLGDPLSVKDRYQYDTDIYGRDGAMFRQAADMMKDGEVRQPFFMTLMTISMHIPFQEKAWPLDEDLSNAKGLSKMEKDYANMCRHTDRAIGEFLTALPSNTIIFIASDHHQSIASDVKYNPRALFMAVNCGRTGRISRTVGQVNLFPATLELLGSGDGYGGVAPSAFDESVDGTMDSYGNIYGMPSPGALDTLKRAYRISDMIIRGDYFKEVSGRAKGR